MKKNLFLTLALILALTLAISCNKDPDNGSDKFVAGTGVYILNEGNFNGGNGSLSFYSYENGFIYNNLFAEANGRPLGDVPNSMIINGDKAYIVVNNSGKIEVVNKSTVASIATINGLKSPRNFAVVSSTSAYVTSIYSDSVAIINLAENTVTGYINLRRTSESIIVKNHKAFISNWVGGNEIMVIDVLTNKVTDSITVGVEPESMVLDRNDMLWVLCNGGWERNNFAELDQISTSSNEVVKKLIFPSKLASPTSLTVNGAGDALFYLENGVNKVQLAFPILPESPLIPQTDHLFYKLGIDPVKNYILVTDAIDYKQQGFVLLYLPDGTLFSSSYAGIIPGSVCFNPSDF